MALCPRKLDPGISFCRGLMFWSQCRKVLKHDNTHTSGCLTYHVDIYIYNCVVCGDSSPFLQKRHGCHVIV